MMASHHDALWAKLHELEQQLAAYKLLRAPRPEDEGEANASARTAEAATCRGRQYDAYMRRRDARREAASAEHPQPVKKDKQPQATRGTRAAGSSIKPMSPRALRFTPRDTQEAKKTPTVSIPSTPRRESAAALPRNRTVNGVGVGATGSPARPHHHHQRRSSLGTLAEFSDSPTTPRPFLKRGTGTGGAAAPARLRTPRVHDIDVLGTPRLPQHHAHAHAATRHARSVSELPPFDASAPLASPATQARARRHWGSPERPAAMVSPAAATDSHRDFSKGLKKLLSFVRKGGKGGDADQPCSSTGSKSGKPVSKGWSGTGRVAACSVLDVPFDRANLDGHRFPMTRTVGISG